VSVSDRTHYDVIEADPSDSKADLKAAYVSALDAAQATGDPDEVAAIRRAWQVLSDPVQRQRYDEQIGVGHRGTVGRSDAEVADDSVDDDVVEGEVLDEYDELLPAPGEGRVLPGDGPAYLEQPTIGRRLTASAIDVVTLAAVFLAAASIVAALSDSPGVEFVVWTVLFEVLAVGLFVIPTIRTGQSLGKRFTFIMTVDRATGNLPSVGQVVRRYIVPMVAVPALFFQLGGFVALFFGLSYAMSRDQLSLADRFAQTVVVVARYTPTRSAA
jgi:uncharacterized RDD family membrane protein YckC